MTRLLESTLVQGPAGPFEALHEAPDAGVRIEQAAVICHPHPLHGGTMHNKVVFRLARAARRVGSAVLRFNFRGVGRSAGAYDEGEGEQDDLRAALGYMNDRYPGLPLAAAGFSFGARVALRVGCSDTRIERVVAAGTPVFRHDWSHLSHCACPKYFLHSTQDEYGSREQMEAVVAAAAEPKKLEWIEASDHFFADALDELEAAACRVLKQPSPEH